MKAKTEIEFFARGQPEAGLQALATVASSKGWLSAPTGRASAGVIADASAPARSLRRVMEATWPDGIESPGRGKKRGDKTRHESGDGRSPTVA